MSELLLEILSEEIPSRFQGLARNQFYTIIEKEFQKHSLKALSLEVFVSSRRLVLSCKNIELNKVGPKRGPRVGARVEAVQGFAKSCGESVKSLEKRNVDGDYYYFSSGSASVSNIKIILSKIIERSLSQISWPKSMHWSDNNVHWVRPIRNIMALFNGTVLPLVFCGLKANNISYGHKVMSPGSFVVEGISQYYEQLLLKKVIVSADERKKIIIDGINKIAQKLNVALVEDESLFNEVIGLVEYPVVKYGKIDMKFLSLPKEVIIKIMASHQKFLALERSNGSLVPYFITVLNIESDNEKEIISGNEKVLSARLYDGKFFFDEDLKTPLEECVPDLKRVIFHDKLGTLFDKVERIEKIAQYLADENIDQVLLKRSVMLSKADLTTYMVNEFPELQGIVGQYYAQYNGEDNEVSKAIYEHYLPIGKDSECPKSLYGALVSIADKMDTVVGLFLVNEMPTSSKDPYGLRRYALGIIRIINQFAFNFNIKDIIQYSAGLYNQGANHLHVSKIIDFVYERFKYWLKLSFRDDLIAAVLFNNSGVIYREIMVLQLIEEMINNNSDVLFAFKRINSIVDSKKIEKDALNQKFITVIEQQLLTEVELLDSNITEFFNTQDSTNLMSVLTKVAKTVNKLFDETMIMDKDLEIRNHRLSVLERSCVVFNKIAHFSLIDL